MEVSSQSSSSSSSSSGHLLVLVLDINPNQVLFSRCPQTLLKMLDSSLSLANAHLMADARNRLTAIAAHSKSCSFLYTEKREEVLPQFSEVVTSGLSRGLALFAGSRLRGAGQDHVNARFQQREEPLHFPRQRQAHQPHRHPVHRLSPGGHPFIFVVLQQLFHGRREVVMLRLHLRELAQVTMLCPLRKPVAREIFPVSAVRLRLGGNDDNNLWAAAASTAFPFSPSRFGVQQLRLRASSPAAASSHARGRLELAYGLHGGRGGGHEPGGGVPQRRRGSHEEADQPRSGPAEQAKRLRGGTHPGTSGNQVRGDSFFGDTSRFVIHLKKSCFFRFHREDMLATLLSQFESGMGSSTSGSRVKCVPSYVAPDLASAIRRHVSQSLRQRKGHFPCYYVTEWATYSLPPGTYTQQLHLMLLSEQDPTCRICFAGRCSTIFAQQCLSVCTFL